MSEDRDSRDRDSLNPRVYVGVAVAHVVFVALLYWFTTALNIPLS